MTRLNCRPRRPPMGAVASRWRSRSSGGMSNSPMTYTNPYGATVGRTPLVELGRLAKPGRVFTKLEMRNPCGSVKDRVGVALVEDAEARGVLKLRITIVEATAGMAVGLARFGHPGLGACPDDARTMSVERVALLKQLTKRGREKRDDEWALA